MESIRYFSTFTGAGGFEEGFKQAWPEAKCVGMSEIDKHANQLIRYRYPEVKNYGDITKIKPEEIPDFDILCGGFPCQAFSIAGNRMGFEDTRGTLFFELARIIKSKGPKVLLFENVEGLLSHQEGRTFAVILSTLDELGYDAEWQLLYSKHQGKPQNRPRVYIVGYIRGESKGAVFPIGQKTKGFIRMVQKRDERFQQGAMVYSKTGIAPTLTRSAAESVVIGDLDRTLTITECERLQGFPDGWTKKGIDESGEEVRISLRERFHLIGNAVTVDVVAAVVRKLKNIYICE